MNTFRGAEVYLQGRTKRRLRWLATAHGAGSDGKPLTADQVADQMLNEAIEARFPQVKELESEYEAAEKRLMTALQGLRTEAK